MRVEREWEGDLDSEVRAERVIKAGNLVREASGTDRLTRANAALTLYHGNARHTYDGAAGFEWGDYVGVNPEPVAYNLIQAAVDTKTNHIVRNKVRPLITTENGDSELQEKATGMQRAVEATLHQSKLWGELGALVCKHACLGEAGGVKISPDYDRHRVDVSIIYAHEILVDPEEARRGEPRRMWHVQPIAREELLARYPDRADEIENAHAAETRQSTHSGLVPDLVEVWEYWHLPSGHVDLDDDDEWEPGAKHGGVHVIAIEGATLLEEGWPYDHFPIALLRFLRPATGFFGTGIPERLGAHQLEINEWSQRIRQIVKAHAVPTLIVSREAKINTAKLTNDPTKVLVVRGAPQSAAMYLVPQSVPSDLFRRIDDIIRHAEKQIGLSEMSIAGMKPKGVDHAPGMQHLADTETIRHTVDFREWEDFYVECSRLIIESYRLLAQHDEEFEIVFSDSKQLQRIKWDKIDLGRDMYHLRTWPTNLLPQTPGARQSKAIELKNAGLFTPEQALMALGDFPDIESIQGDATAAFENIERMIAAAKAGRMKDATPEPYMNLELARTQIVNAINRAQANGEPEEKVENLRKIWQQTDALLKRAALEAAQIAQGVAPGMAPPAAPPGPVPAPPMN